MIKANLLPHLLLGFVLTLSINLSAQTKKNTNFLPPVIGLLTADDSAQISEIDAARFLMQSSFGPTDESINALMNTSYEGWINQQIRIPPTYHLQYADDVLQQVDNNGRLLGGHLSSWLLVSARADDQLRQRMAFMWSELFVVSRRTMGVAHTVFAEYYDVLLDHSFDNFRDLLEVVTLNSVMGSYLNMHRNRKRDLTATPPVVRADENYAREIMQLFTIGLEELELDGTPKLDRNGNRIPTYTEADVEQFAKVFTGFAYGSSFNDPGATAGRASMNGYPQFHDQTSKRLLRGRVLPAGQSPDKDLKDALDNLFEHPNVAPFICKQMIQKLVTSNPTPAYVRDCSNSFNQQNSANKKGDIRRVLKTILLHNEARNGHELMPKTFGKIKEPLIQLVGAWRAMGIQKKTPFVTVHEQRMASFNQLPLNSPTVFNFFSPHFAPQGVIAQNNLLAPESQLLSLSGIVDNANAKYILTNASPARNPNATNEIMLSGDRFKALVPNDLRNPEAFIDRMNLLLMAGAMPDSMRESLLKVHDQSDGYIPQDAYHVMTDILRLILVSPYANIQR